ncbi:hypothetical protein Q7P37_008979 [Cladosporium fusiforme]
MSFSYQQSFHNDRTGQAPAAPSRAINDDNWRDHRQPSTTRQFAAPSAPRNFQRLEQRPASSVRRENTRPERQPASGPRGVDSWRPRRDNSRPTRDRSASPRPSPPPPAVERNVVPGSIMYLPRMVNESSCPNYSPELQKQSHVNEKAGNHPVLVWDVYDRSSDKEKIARCMPVTAFHSQAGGVEEKYSRGTHAWRHIVRYLPIEHGAGSSSSYNVPVLALADGKRMKIQSYVHLDHFYEVEAKFLDATNPCCAGLRLQANSLAMAVGKLQDFCDGRIWCQGLRPGAPKSPLHEGGYGRPTGLSEEANNWVTLGRQLEQLRLTMTGTEAVTGHEAERPNRTGARDRDAARWLLRYNSLVSEREALQSESADSAPQTPST